MKLTNLFFVLVLLTLTKVANQQKVEKMVMNDINIVQTDLDKFMHQMSMVESNNTLRAVNRFGMMGKYQFSPRTLKGLGIDVSKEEFLSNENLQDSAMVALIKHNRRALRHIIHRYEGKIVNGVRITESGILAGAHLVGAGGVLAFFNPEKYLHNTVDGNGVSVVYYMNKFANYDIKL